MGAALELLARLLVDVGSAEHRPPVDGGGQRERAPDVDAGALRRLDDLARRLVEELVVVRLQADADLVAGGHGVVLVRARRSSPPAPAVQSTRGPRGGRVGVRPT